MPSTIPVTHDQLVALADLECDVVLHELPATGVDGTLNVWITNGDSETNHRDIIIDHEGTKLGDTILEG